MRLPPVRLPALALLALAACAANDRRDGRAEPSAAAARLTPDGQGFEDGARLAGAPQSCVPLSQIRQSHVRSDRVIDFEGIGHRLYRNVLPQDCPQLGFEQRFAYQTSINQLCSTDIITVLQSPGLSRGPSCGLGQFQPITLDRR